MFVSVHNTTAQTQTEHEQKMMWLADYDTFAQTLLLFNPTIQLKEQLFQYAIRDSIHQFRNEVNYCNTQNDFIQVLKKAANVTIDGHTAILTPSEPTLVELRLYLTYIDGEYITMRTFTYNENYVPAGSKVISVNGLPVHDAVQLLVPYRYMMRYDVERNRFYNELFYLSDNFIQTGNIILQFAYQQGLQEIDFKLNSQVSFGQPISFTNNGKEVVYFEELQLLYVKMPSMQYADRKWYMREIIKTGKGKIISKVVVDVRNNSGGSSITGRNTMRAIIDKPVALPNEVYGCNPAFLSSKYLRTHHINKDADETELPFFDKVISYKWLSDTTLIRPLKRGLHFNGPIYIVGNEWIYSAAGAIFNFADLSKTDQIFSVGTPTGMLLGEFTDPVQMELPLSKIKYQVAVSFDFTSVKNQGDVFKENYDFVVLPELTYFTKYYQYKGSLTHSDWLLKQDIYMLSIILK